MSNVDASASSPSWLPVWIAGELASGRGRRAEVKDAPGDAIYVLTSVGFDAVLTWLGEVWVIEHDPELSVTGAPSSTWRRSEGLERIGHLVTAARRFGMLHALLPLRPTGAIDCPDCRGTGDWHLFSADRHESLRITGVVCKGCGGLGWR